MQQINTHYSYLQSSRLRINGAGCCCFDSVFADVIEPVDRSSRVLFDLTCLYQVEDVHHRGVAQDVASAYRIPVLDRQVCRMRFRRSSTSSGCFPGLLFLIIP